MVESTQIIRNFIAKDKIGALLEYHDPKQLELLLNNFSPAKMAFESEVLSSAISLVVVYYFKKSESSSEFINQLKDLSIKYDDEIKFVIIDVDALFSLAQDAEIEMLPTILLVKGREVSGRIENHINIEILEQKLISSLIR